MKLSKSITIISILLNLFLVAIFSVYHFTPLFDFIVINKSLPRLCQVAENENVEFPICKINELVENQK